MGRLNDLKEKWEDILNSVKTEYEVSDIAFKTWITPLEVYSVDEDLVTLLTPLKNDINVINTKYLKFIQVTVCEYMGWNVDFQVLSQDDLEEISIKEKNNDNIKANNTVSYSNNPYAVNLNPNYTFDTFIVGNNNNMAHSAALQVAEEPARVYNPLFIYGGVGLGKTHLMQAIAHYIISNDPSKRVLFVTSETFTNDLIDSIRNKNSQEFRDKYRKNVDVLLIDDIQFIIGKEATQEEFFNTFNDLIDNNKQIIVSSDRPPKEMSNLAERITSRLNSGLNVDIQIPTYETKMAIISKKCEINNYNISDDIKDFIATNITSSIREIEGALKKITAYSKLSNTPLTLEFAEETLKDYITDSNNKELNADIIIDVVAEHFNISKEGIRSEKRTAELVFPRHVAMYLCQQMLPINLQAIGRAFGKKDHSTVIHGIKKIQKEVLTNESTKSTIEILIKKLSPS